MKYMGFEWGGGWTKNDDTNEAAAAKAVSNDRYDYMGGINYEKCITDSKVLITRLLKTNDLLCVCVPVRAFA